ncbi:TetR/AcrR family transcriptional regulator [Oceanicella sp. SM1341]|uniref:TetR/AcrR family transcriptional regulator n=1 Tax=Oceanicella sp. SM1341 TaxID=1548889 RepID=UPI000E524552|nr:TetR/AcrR family transcriptional regulator [Oceanicella sp. SM1341]
MSDKPYHHGDLRRALVEAGLGILEESGLEALTLRACAARAGVSHAAPRNHFDGLTGLLAAITAEGFRRHEAALRAGIAAAPEAPQLGALRGYVAFAQANPALFKLMFGAKKLHDDPELSEAANGSLAVLAGIAEGLDWPGAGDREAAMAMLWALAHGVADLTVNNSLRACTRPDGTLPGLAEIYPGYKSKKGAPGAPS